jgi:hypothetical protein
MSDIDTLAKLPEGTHIGIVIRKRTPKAIFYDLYAPVDGQITTLFLKDLPDWKGYDKTNQASRYKTTDTYNFENSVATALRALTGNDGLYASQLA